ncbi:hypothetical protein N9L02_03790, partial [Gammaproteobacteria bacterium]|nr:hypothetical protein [Gammaproteobacteria bacterium]
MKKIIAILTCIIASINIVGCANMTNEDSGTLSGAIIGGLLGSQLGDAGGNIVAIGIGTMAGAYLGGSIGKSMDELDRMKVNQTLENKPIGQPAYWVNKNSGVKYTVVPVKNITHRGNRYCREYRTTAFIAGRQQQVYGTACRR